MAPLARMDGVWRGPAWSITQAGRRELVQTERIGTFLDGSVRVIEGRGYDADGSVGFNALGIISFNPATSSLHASPPGRMGQAGVFPLRPTADGYVWEVPAGPGMTIRYTATIRHGTLARGRRADRRRRAAGADLRDEPAPRRRHRLAGCGRRCRCADDFRPASTRRCRKRSQGATICYGRAFATPARSRVRGRRGMSRVGRHVDLRRFMEGVKRRNPGQTEFVQAVQEVAEDIFDFIADKEPYHHYQILRRIAEPDRVISFRVCWEDDNSNIRVQRG